MAMTESITIRRATVDDAAGIQSIWEVIAAEKIYSAIDQPFSVDQERVYLQSLKEREGIFIAEVDGKMVGFQSLDLWVKVIRSMDHVGQLGTFVLPQWRGRRVGEMLAQHTLSFARAHGYEKLVLFVRASNPGAQKFYAALGFRECGRFARQVKIDTCYDDEVLMELFL
jgi:ribosomal protein S18 acetylase RimI-like enzyme